MKEKEAPSGIPVPSLVMRLIHHRPLSQAQDKVEHTQIPCEVYNHDIDSYL